MPGRLAGASSWPEGSTVRPWAVFDMMRHKTRSIVHQSSAWVNSSRDRFAIAFRYSWLVWMWKLGCLRSSRIAKLWCQERRSNLTLRKCCFSILQVYGHIFFSACSGDLVLGEWYSTGPSPAQCSHTLKADSVPHLVPLYSCKRGIMVENPMIFQQFGCDWDWIEPLSCHPADHGPARWDSDTPRESAPKPPPASSTAAELKVMQRGRVENHGAGKLHQCVGTNHAELV